MDSATPSAITRFQLRQFGWQDGVINPGNKTLNRMNELAQPGPPDPKTPVSRQFLVRVAESRLLRGADNRNSDRMLQFMDMGNTVGVADRGHPARNRPPPHRTW